MNMIAKRIVFAGTVQGVGFRFTAYQIARNCQVAGWVTNLPDGSVEIQVKGDKKEVNEFLNTLRNESRVSELIRESFETDIALESISPDSDFVIRQ